MSIWEYANPKKFMQTSAWALPWVTGLAVVTLIGALNALTAALESQVLAAPFDEG